MLRKGYVLLRRVFLFKHFTSIPRPKCPGGARPAPPAAPQARPGSPKPPAGCRPIIQAACPEARRPSGQRGDHRQRSQPPARPPTGRSARGRAAGAGDPGERALGLLIPLKVADQRRLCAAQAARGGGRPGRGPQTAGGGSWLRESRQSAPTRPGWNSLLLGPEGRVWVPSSPREQNSVPCS